MTGQDGKDPRGDHPDNGGSHHEDLPEGTTGPNGPVYPEPPSNWKPGRHSDNDEDRRPSRQDLPNMGVVGKTVIHLTEQESIVFSSARKYITASQIVALISLFFGGILLSTVAIFIAYLGYRKMAWIADCRKDQPEVQYALKRAGVIAIGMGVLALVINIVSLIFFYPMLVDSLQQGNLGALLPGAQPQASPSSPAPGAELFG